MTWDCEGELSATCGVEFVEAQPEMMFHSTAVMYNEFKEVFTICPAFMLDCDLLGLNLILFVVSGLARIPLVQPWNVISLCVWIKNESPKCRSFIETQLASGRIGAFDENQPAGPLLGCW